MTTQEKQWIDSASLTTLLQKWRFAPSGSRYFCDDPERAAYFQKVMTEKKEADPDGWVRASKMLGWGS